MRVMYLSNPPANQRGAVDDGKQYVISQHAKGTTSISTPSIYSSTNNPWDVKILERWCWNGECHNESATNTKSPSKDLKTKTNSITFEVTFNPVPYV